VSRRSVYVEGFGHRNPVPAACRIDDLLCSGIVYGLDAATGKPAATLEQQCALMFAHIRSIVEAGGGDVADIVKINVWMTDRSHRDPLNAEWLRMFPDAMSRPARQVLQGTFSESVLIWCDFSALIRSTGVGES
jgi:2-iminobutanoate/2-iminopropanoate deaminase